MLYGTNQFVYPNMSHSIPTTFSNPKLVNIQKSSLNHSKPESLNLYHKRLGLNIQT